MSVREFPGFVLDVPIPDGFVDISDPRSPMPSWLNRECSLSLWIDYQDPWERGLEEWRRDGRFHLVTVDEDGDLEDEILTTDDYAEVLKMIQAECGTQPLWGPRRGEVPEQPEIPAEKPWRRWWYTGYGQGAVSHEAFPEPLPDHFRDLGSMWAVPSLYSEKYNVLIQKWRGQAGPYYKAFWGVDERGQCINPSCSNVAHLDWWTVVEEVEDRVGASVFEIEGPAEEYEAPSTFLPPPGREAEEFERSKRALTPDDWRRWWYTGYGGNMNEQEMRQRAEALAWHDTRDSYWEGPEDGSDKSNWAMTISKHRDSGLLDESNFEVISEDMERRFPDDVENVRFSHWAVGWIDHLFVRIYDDAGRFTSAFDAIIEWEQKLADYPVADEEHYSELEYETAIQNIENEGRMYVGPGAPDHWAYDVHEWLSENNERALYNEDDRGAFPSEAEIKEALENLDLIDPHYV